MKHILLSGLLLLTACHAFSSSQPPPTQVVYRFDDHRYLELTGFNCEGALWYTDTQRDIHTEVTSQFYRLFTKKFIHPSERYISITYWDVSGFIISKDYGKTWQNAHFTPGTGAERYGSTGPEKENVESFTVVNDQGFLLTKKGELYMSSKPFDDPRMQPGGEGIPFTFIDDNGARQHDRLMPGTAGRDWGEDYASWNAVDGSEAWTVLAYKPNWQGIPNKVPEVKDYTGWDHMRCDPDLGLPATEQEEK
ncbi:hypothetical protein NFT50_002435 [Salmonella enterica]|nr:hypothetical protein [Salmonella enterica subsp. enterica]EDS4738182.1 hypothetical protein [Salmonella enterica subsp. enterica serovar Oranienburg]EDU6364633.1 hypothetical protein [Salmonella enterica subsp. enterica serovar Florian]EJH7015781.1 hypothetical protein [Salmonella enterica]EHM3440508.1 hypothetical protein [Salmonella enterica subsp. enterica]